MPERPPNTRGFHPVHVQESANPRASGRGVLIYWHVEKKPRAIHSPLIDCTGSEGAAMAEGAIARQVRGSGREP
ncbi:Tn3 family transposase [Streptomyces sp. NPDC048483]|uniref:Tn3 family transposase n=1 Tax=Streptomyces sp. NPDC048483 TaxID=3154927 RepID=UPI003419516B